MCVVSILLCILGGKSEISGICPEAYYCPPGTYNNVSNLCPNGTYSPNTGVGYVWECQNCTQGGYTHLTGILFMTFSKVILCYVSVFFFVRTLLRMGIRDKLACSSWPLLKVGTINKVACWSRSSERSLCILSVSSCQKCTQVGYIS